MSKRVAILGAGVIGLSCALACARRGMKVSVIERQAAARRGCSFGNAGMVVPSHFLPLAVPGMVWRGLRWMGDPESPFYIKPRPDLGLIDWGLRFWRAATRERAAAAAVVLRDLGLLSRAEFEGLGLEFGLVKRGLLMLCKEQASLDEEGHTAEMSVGLGIPAQVLDAGATAALDPGITMDVRGSVYYPMDCHLSPERLVAAMEEELVRLGAEFLWGLEVVGFRGERGMLRAVVTGGGEIEADEFVLSGGVWSTGLVKGLGLRLPMQAGKGYSLTLERPRELPELCSICTEARLAVTPMGGALRIGGTMEMAGIDESISRRRVRGIVRAVPEYFPMFREEDFEGVVPWSGLRPVSPDGLPYLGRSGRCANLIVATGHAMMGLSLAPGTGRIVAELVSGEVPTVGIGLLSPDRY
jgi:D-amino-acid dehydrogenase